MAGGKHLYAPDKTQGHLERAMRAMANFKAREERIVRGLGVVQEALAAGDSGRASLGIDSLMQTDLKDAREASYNAEFALTIAVTDLMEQSGLQGKRGKKAVETLKRLRALVPHVFEKIERSEVLPPNGVDE